MRMMIIFHKKNWSKWSILGPKTAHCYNSVSAVKIFLQFCTIKRVIRKMKVTLHVMRYWFPSKSTPHPSQIGNPASVPKFFNLPSPYSVQTFYSPPPPPTETSTWSYFRSYDNWLDAVINDFWRSWNNTLEKHVFTIILFILYVRWLVFH